MKHNHIPDVMSEFDCQVISNHNIIRKLNNAYDFIECDGQFVCCERGEIEPADSVYLIY